MCFGLEIRKIIFRYALLSGGLVKHRIGVEFVLRPAICLHLASSNDQRLVLGMITSLHSTYKTSCYYHGRHMAS